MPVVAARDPLLLAVDGLIAIHGPGASSRSSRASRGTPVSTAGAKKRALDARRR